MDHGIPFNPGRSKFNVIQTMIASVNWVELMGNLWNSSGKFSSLHDSGKSWIRFNRWLQNYSVKRELHGQYNLHLNGSRHSMEAKGNYVFCVNKSKTIKEYAQRFPCGQWSFLEPGSGKKWYGTWDGKSAGSCNRTVEKMLQNFDGSGHPISRSTSPVERTIRKQSRRSRRKRRRS